MSRKSFLSIGECMVELAQIDAATYRRGFAGDTFNTAWYARQLLPDTWRVSYASCIGTDAVSDEMAAFIRKADIETGTLRRVSDRTVGLYMISTDKGERSFSYWRSQSAARALAADAEWLWAALSGRDVIYFSGITLAILPPEGRKTLLDALAAARAEGALVAFDTNLRPRLWEDAATMKAEMARGAGVADVVLPSLDEELLLFGAATPEETIARYREGGARIVAVKNGAEAVTIWSAETGVQTLAPAPVRRVVDTTAAGDSFGAAFVSGLATGQTLQQAAEQAMRLSAKVIQAQGALVPGLN